MKIKFLTFGFLTLNACATPSTSAPNHVCQSDKIMQVNVGDSVIRLTETLGKPTGINKEKFSSIEYEVWEYSSADGKPLGFFTLDHKDKRVVGRSVEGDRMDSADRIDELLSARFMENKFDKYFPCKSRGYEEVLVDAQQGIFIATRDSKVSIVSWADPQLTKLRIDQFYAKCPQLQPSRKSK